ncbi:unnamed protein product [Pylaiella littoralis]
MIMVSTTSTDKQRQQQQHQQQPEVSPPTQPVHQINSQGAGGIVRLNVGGKKFLTSWETIMHAGNSMLASMFKGKFKCTTDEDGFAFIDRDGERFRHVLNFLRCSSLPSFDEAWRYEEIMEEADFYAIEELRQARREYSKANTHMHVHSRIHTTLHSSHWSPPCNWTHTFVKSNRVVSCIHTNFGAFHLHRHTAGQAVTAAAAAAFLNETPQVNITSSPGNPKWFWLARIATLYLRWC